VTLLSSSNGSSFIVKNPQFFGFEGKPPVQRKIDRSKEKKIVRKKRRVKARSWERERPWSKAEWWSQRRIQKGEKGVGSLQIEGESEIWEGDREVRKISKLEIGRNRIGVRSK